MLVGAEDTAALFSEIKYPKKLRVYIVLCIIGLVMLFVNLGVACLVIENIDVLPKVFQDEGIIVGLCVIVEIIVGIISFAFAFRARKIRKTAMREHLKNLADRRKQKMQK